MFARTWLRILLSCCDAGCAAAAAECAAAQTPSRCFCQHFNTGTNRHLQSVGFFVFFVANIYSMSQSVFQIAYLIKYCECRTVDARQTAS